MTRIEFQERAVVEEVVKVSVLIKHLRRVVITVSRTNCAKEGQDEWSDDGVD